MTDLIAARLLDNTFSSTKGGYSYSIVVDANNYTATALPTSAKHGRYGHYSAEDAIVRYVDRV